MLCLDPTIEARGNCLQCIVQVLYTMETSAMETSAMETNARATVPHMLIKRANKKWEVRSRDKRDRCHVNILYNNN